MDGTILQQGVFIAPGGDVTLKIRSDVDFINVYNYSTASAAVQFDGVEFYWQRGMLVNDAFIKYHAAGSQILSESTVGGGIAGAPAGSVGGFTLVDSSIQSFGLTATIVSISTGTPPLVTTAGATTLKTGDIVRLKNVVGAPQLSGIDFVITVVSPTTFTLDGGPTIAVAATGGTVTKINFEPYFYPRRRVISNILRPQDAGGVANGSLITTTVPHGYTIGQAIRINVTPAEGMVEMNGLLGTVVGIPSPISFVINIDSGAFTAFVFPAAAAGQFTPAEAVPVGEDTGIALLAATNILADATINTAYIGIILAGGAAAPAGVAGNQIFWVAGKSFSNTIGLVF